MDAPRVVVAQHEAWILGLLTDGLRDAAFVVVPADTAAEALEKVRAAPTDCVIVDTSLPDADGYSLAIAIRAEPPPTSIVPIALLAAADDPSARTAAFDAGADAIFFRPFRVDDIVAQTMALVQLARRMRERRTSLVDSLAAGPSSASFKGDLSQMPVSSLLLLVDIERRSGAVEVRSKRKVASFEIAEGAIVSASLGKVAREPLAVLKEVLTWTEGRVAFHVSAARRRPPNARAIRALLADAGHAPALEAPPRAASVARMQAIPPPPGQRVSSMRLEAQKPAAPALASQDTRRVDVPSITMAPPSTRRNDKKS